ncbi:MAG: O-antigen ligase family protein [Rhodoferax sp.]|uniref:O-antigen ligase family protein n=1 Tax=Rhodoferax sp. TaxID=50421 RepID=UPI00301ADF57
MGNSFITSRSQNLTALLLSLMMVLVPALGVPHEMLLQDTLKSMLVAFFALTASFAFFWQKHKQRSAVNWHGVMALPLTLMAYALGSMAWSHAYLGGVEAVRWFLFSLILFLGMNTFTLNRVTQLAWGIHFGAVIASLWAALQFWVDFKFFAQGPNPASTFVNRNFFGEFLVCTLPFSVLLLSRLKDKISVFLQTFSLGFNIVALMMTGTRSALAGLLILVVLLPIALMLYSKQFVSTGWSTKHWLSLAALLMTTVMVIGSINTENPSLITDTGQGNAIDRAFKRTLSMTKGSEYSQGSFSIRALMWQSTARMIAANPVTGVGAGAWEVQAPLYQETGSLLETDYYAHNEILQLLAEYGLLGWLFFLCLLAYLLSAAHRTLTDRCPQVEGESLLRALTLSSLLVFLLVSNAGFPWRMATTGALFALSLSILAASDMRLGVRWAFLATSVSLNARLSVVALCITAACTGIALYLSQQAILCESKIIRAVKIALTISRSSQPNDPGWEQAKLEMLALINEGIAINPHYRKITPIVADSLAAWGDWKNATWIWETVLESRPKVVAMLANVVRGHIKAKDFSKAQNYLDSATKIQSTAPALATLQVFLWSQTGKNQEAAALARELLMAGVIEPDLVRTAYFLGTRYRDPALAILALELRIKTWPNQAVDGWLKLGDIFNAPDAKDDVKALYAYQAAMVATLPAHKNAILAMIPPAYRVRIEQAIEIGRIR